MRRTLTAAIVAAVTLAVMAAAAPAADPPRVITVTAGNIDFEEDKQSIVATGGVEVRGPEGTIWADKMETISGDKGRLRTLELTGNVKADLHWERPDSKRCRFSMEADHGSYAVADGILALTGDVRVGCPDVAGVQTSVVKADKATLYLRECRCVVQGAAIEIIRTDARPEAETAPK